MVCEMCPFMEMETGGAAQLAPNVIELDLKLDYET